MNRLIPVAVVVLLVAAMPARAGAQDDPVSAPDEIVVDASSVTPVMVASPEPAGPAQPITLKDAMQKAIDQNPQVLAGEMTIEAAVAARKVVRASFFPVMQADLTFMVYNEAPGFGSFGGGSQTALPDCDTVFNELDEQVLCEGLTQMLDFSSLGDSFKAEQWDVKVTVTVAQPLTPLYQVYHGYKLADLGVDVAKIELEKTKADLKMHTVKAYYGYLEAASALEAMDEALVSVEAHVNKARAFHEAEFITKNDLLQAEVRYAELQGQKLQVEQGVTLAGEGLALLINEPAGQNVVPAGQSQEELAFITQGGLPQTEAEALDLAAKNRPELKQMAVTLEQASEAIKLTKGGYIPSVSVFGSYQHEEGSVMELPAFTFGASLNWNFFQWGKVYYSVDEAKARAAAAQAATEALEKAVKFEVKQALLSIQLSTKQIEIQKGAVAAAEEQLRIEKERYDQKVNTTTEVLDATMRLVQAQVTLSTYQYEYLVALAALRKACGTL